MTYPTNAIEFKDRTLSEIASALLALYHPIDSLYLTNDGKGAVQLTWAHVIFERYFLVLEAHPNTNLAKLRICLDLARFFGQADSYALEIYNSIYTPIEVVNRETLEILYSYDIIPTEINFTLIPRVPTYAAILGLLTEILK